MAFFKLSDLSEKEKKKYLQSIENQVNQRLDSRNSLEKEANNNFNNVFNSKYGQNNNINVENKDDWVKTKINTQNLASANSLLAPVETKINEDLYKSDLKNSAQKYYDNGNISSKNKNVFEDILGIGENLFKGASSGLKQTMNYSTAVNKGYDGYNNITRELARAKYLATPIQDRKEEDLNKNFIEEAVNNSIQEDNRAISKNINSMSGKVTQKLAELAPSIGQMGAGTILNIINPALGTGYFYSSAAGGYLDDAKARGMDDKQALVYSSVLGGLEAATEEVGIRNFEKAGAGIKALISGTGKEGVKSAIEGIAQKEITTSVKDVLKNYGIGIADNFVQEAIMDPLQEISATAVAGKEKADWSDMGQKMLQDGINGGLVSAIVGGANLGIQSCTGVIEKIQNNQQVTNQEFKQAVADAGQQLDTSQMVKNSVKQQANKYKDYIANDKETLYNNSKESESDYNERHNGQTFGRYDETTGLYEENKHKQIRKYNWEEYDKWEKSIRPIETDKLTNKQRESIEYARKEYNKDVVLYDEKINDNTYSGGASKEEKGKIIISQQAAEEFGLNKIIDHENVESDILHNEKVRDILSGVIEMIKKDEKFDLQKEKFWKWQEENIPTDDLIAKDIICDRFSEIRQKEKVDYENVLSNATNTTIDNALANYYSQVYGKELEIPSSFSLPQSKQNEYTIPTKSNVENREFNSNIDKYNSNKKKKIKANEEAINSLTQYKNESIKSIENKIVEKENVLKNLKNSDTKLAANIRNQIANLKVTKSKIENDYNLKIDKFYQKNTKERLEIETQNRMKKDAREKLGAEIKPLLSGFENWKDKDLFGGFRYNRETAQRNTYDVVKNKSQADAINKTIFDPIQVHQAEKTRETNRIFNKINSLDLDKTKKYDYIHENAIKPIKIDEATIAQLYIEKKINETDLRKYNIDANRIKKISKEFTSILDDLYNQMNETLVEYGYSPIKKIENYFPHFTENKADSTLGKIASYFGIEINNQELPTEIAGKTDTFKPGKTWNANILKRNTNKTDYDALKILERYVNGAEDIIHTTGDIQKVREFSKQIRYNFSDDGVKERIDNINNNEDLMQFEKEEAIDAIFSQEKNQLSHYVTWLDDYANTLANKKSFSDRNIEREVGRNIYNNMANIESRIAANTIGGNLSVSLTNFAPIFQSMGSTKPINVLMGMIETTKNNILGMTGKKDTSFVQNSNFLTNRFGTDTISAKTKTQNISDILSKPMNMIDEFTSESIVRAKYRENLQNGLSEYEALDKADKDTARIMADRSKGALPVAFNKKNPLSKLMTMFQVEPNNIVSNYFKDMPQSATTKKQLAYNYGKLMAASYAFNTIIMAIRGGSEVLPDPIRMVSYMIKWLTGEDDDEKEKAKNDLTEAIISLTPFVQNVAGLLGYEDIGRIPISNAMPDLTKISSLMDKDVDSNYRNTTLIKEMSKPLLYLGLPVGGAQLNKTIKGIETLKSGGSYTINKKGEKLLQFPVENNNISNYGKAVVFGKWSLPEAQNYSKTLNAKQTKIYEESNIPYKELLDYIDKGMTKKEDKLNYLNSTNLTAEQKWGIYKYDILSNTTRTDGSSQLKDAEYMIKNGVSKAQFIKIYNKAQKNDIEMPTQEEYKQMKKSNISLNSYIDLKIKEKEERKKKKTVK